MSQPSRKYVDRRADQFRRAVETRDTVLAWTTIGLVLADGYTDLGGDFINTLSEHGLASMAEKLGVEAHV